MQRTDVSGRTRLLADFHVLIAQMRATRCWPTLADLVTRSSLIALMYQSSHSAEHSFAEHVAIVDADGRAPAQRRGTTCASTRARPTSATPSKPYAPMNHAPTPAT